MDYNSRDIHSEIKGCHLERQTDLYPKFAVFLPFWYYTHGTSIGSSRLRSQVSADKLNYYFMPRNLTLWSSNIHMSLLRLPDSGKS